MNTHWDKYTKPPADICPKDFCFNWIPPDGNAEVSNVLHSSIDEALEQSSSFKSFPEGGCSCTFGPCSRIDQSPEARDWYEAVEPLLEKHDLPWFYFIPSTDKLVDELHEEYLREAKKLWG